MRKILQPILAVALGLALGLGVTRIAGESPWHILQILWKSAFGSSYDFGMTLFYSTPLIFTGLAVAVPFQAGMFNIGAEGQLTLGALAAAGAGAGAALRVATALLRGSVRLGAARRGAGFALCVFFTLLVLDPGFLPGIAALLQVTGHLRTRDYTDAWRAVQGRKTAAVAGFYAVPGRLTLGGGCQCGARRSAMTLV